MRRILESILTRQKGFPHNGHIAIKHFISNIAVFLSTKSLGLFLQSCKLKFYFARAPNNYYVINFNDILFIIIILSIRLACFLAVTIRKVTWNADSI